MNGENWYEWSYATVILFEILAHTDRCLETTITKDVHLDNGSSRVAGRKKARESIVTKVTDNDSLH
jgi:hypothetical protein